MKEQTKALRKKNAKKAHRLKRKMRIRKKISGNEKTPRLCVFRSSKHIYVQAISDVTGQTLASSSTADKELKDKMNGLKPIEKAKAVGKKVAEKLIAKKIVSVRFDTGGFSYAGRVASLANAARQIGLKF